MAGFVDDAWAGAIMKHAARTSVSWEALNLHSRRGHSEDAHTDQEWDELRAARRRRFREWRNLTDELLKEGVLGHEHCYECAGELRLNEDRPSNWIWDESEDEHRARIGAGHD